MANGQVENKEIETRLFINGKFQEAEDGATFDIASPYSRKVVAKVSEASEADTDAAVSAAKAAFPAWSALTPSERGAKLKKFGALMREHSNELASLEAMSMGRPVATYFDAYAAADLLDRTAETGWLAHGKTSLNTPGFVSMTFRQPFGVAAAIIPWNAPILFFCMKAAPALVTGNTVVIKSSEKAPLTSAKLAQLTVEAGFPPGVINVLSGHGPRSGAALSSHMDVRVLSFTGSGRTGRIIQAAAAKSNLKTVILELGGKSPAIVFEDADIKQAAQDLQTSIKFLSGQMCMASSRVYVEESVREKFVQEYLNLIGQVQVGDPLDINTTHGPQADQTQYETVKGYIESGKQAGGRVLAGGEVAQEVGKDGYSILPTVFSDLPEDSKMMKEEIFGSVVNISTFKTEEEALAKANATEYGLYASVYTKDISRAMRVAKGFESGTVGINCTSPTFSADLPFGGYKASGQGREGLTESIEHYLENKTIMLKIS